MKRFAIASLILITKAFEPTNEFDYLFDWIRSESAEFEDVEIRQSS